VSPSSFTQKKFGLPIQILKVIDKEKESINISKYEELMEYLVNA